MKNHYQIREFGSFVCEKDIQGYISLTKNTFDALEEFILENQRMDDDALDLFSISVRKGIGKIITAKNYVGMITMKDGTTIEILPKIHSEIEDTDGKRSKRLIIDMLKTLNDMPFKTVQNSNLDVARLNIFEIFIRMFIDEAFCVVKKGIKLGYERVEGNELFFKGKMKFSQQIKYNHSHKERNYVEYDLFTLNRPENRLIKSTILYLFKNSISSKNRLDLKTLLRSFEEVEISHNYMDDMKKCVSDRTMKQYKNVMRWCKVFLLGHSFTSFSGSEVAAALLFPMESLFESYIATLLKRQVIGTQYSISIQDRKFHLFDLPERRFLMKPDIVVKDVVNGNTYVIDTKWKILADSSPNYGISQTDMYQMYAYHKKYDARNVIIVYPSTDNVIDKDCIEFVSEDKATVKVRFVDLFDHNCMQNLIESLSLS